MLLSMEVMVTSHKGLTKNYHLLFKHGGSRNWENLNKPLLLIAAAKIGLILFTATLSQFFSQEILISTTPPMVLLPLSHPLPILEIVQSAMSTPFGVTLRAMLSLAKALCCGSLDRTTSIVSQGIV